MRAMRQMYSCPNCNSSVNDGAQFCPQCGTQMEWPQQPPLLPNKRPTLIAARQPYHFEQQEDPVWQQVSEEPRSRWRTIAVSVLVPLILAGVTLGVLQATVWGKTGTNPSVSAKTISSTSHNTTSLMPTSSNVTQPNLNQPNKK
jgi:hypothetical protein